MESHDPNVLKPHRLKMPGFFNSIIIWFLNIYIHSKILLFLIISFHEKNFSFWLFTLTEYFFHLLRKYYPQCYQYYHVCFETLAIHFIPLSVQNDFLGDHVISSNWTIFLFYFILLLTFSLESNVIRISLWIGLFYPELPYFISLSRELLEKKNIPITTDMHVLFSALKPLDLTIIVSTTDTITTDAFIIDVFFTVMNRLSKILGCFPAWTFFSEKTRYLFE